MPPGDDNYTHVVTTILRDMAEQVGKIRQEVKEDTAQLLRSYREDVHRAIMAIHIRIVSLEDTIDSDRASRIARQKRLDTQLRIIKRWVWVVVAIVLIALGVGVGIWWF